MDLAAWDGAAAVLRRHSMPDESTETPIRQARTVAAGRGRRQPTSCRHTPHSQLPTRRRAGQPGRQQAFSQHLRQHMAKCKFPAAGCTALQHIVGHPGSVLCSEACGSSCIGGNFLGSRGSLCPHAAASSSSRQAVEGAGSAAEAGSSAGGVLKALSAAHSFLARLAQAGCGPLLQACPHAAERLLGVSAAALRLAYRPLPTQASDTAHAASQVQTAAVAMLHASRGIACRVARHDLLASSDAGHGSAAARQHQSVCTISWSA